MKKQKKIPVIIRRNPGTGQIIVMYPKTGEEPGICRVERECKTTVLRDSSDDYHRVMACTEPAMCDEEARILKKIKDETGLNVVARTRWGGPKKAVSSVR